MEASWVKHIMSVLRDGVELENESEGGVSGVGSDDDGGDDDSDDER